jgi:hypothetical protein
MAILGRSDSHPKAQTGGPLFHRIRIRIIALIRLSRASQFEAAHLPERESPGGKAVLGVHVFDDPPHLFQKEFS